MNGVDYRTVTSSEQPEQENWVRKNSKTLG